ncbi:MULTISPECIES: hypothetical protein [unclassified Bradyrhizobium]|jgi:DNA-directed RNA polymerase specialized sigma24 family protein|uniref:hypothetical protein n=1 Tax=unclassified Bradyrhizobium TaxID=2631580 RepID=UPI000402A4FA|nr:MULTISPECIES: hypothetical protein [unclassified Bradyrhizobium]MCK7668877.1 hypothetical protein [Bradyrhizobium sp. 2S1]
MQIKPAQWTTEDEHRLLQLLRETLLTQREIAQELGRTEAAVNCRLSVIRKRLAGGRPDEPSPSLMRPHP